MFTFLFYIFFSPINVIEAVAKIHDVSSLELYNICRRESVCDGRDIGLHTKDSWAAARMYKKALQLGYIDAISCHNYLVEDGDYERWGVRGSYGLSAAFYIRYLSSDTFPCPDPELLDSFFWSTWVAAKVISETPSCPQRVERWVGKGKWNRLSEREKKRKIYRQCLRKISHKDLNTVK